MSIKQESQKSDSDKAKTLVAASVVMLLISGGMLGALWVKNRQAALVSLSSPAHRDLPGNKPPEFVAQKEREAHDKVMQMREQWRVSWALKHKDLLRAMTRARPSDDSAWMHVVAAVPVSPSKAEVGFDFDSNAVRQGGNSDVVGTTWETIWPVKPGSNDPKVVARVEQINLQKEAFFRDVMSTWHDVKLSEVGSIAARRTCCLWVSGRVTWRILRPVRVGTGTQTHYEFAPEKQDTPPYDFVTQENTS